MSVSGRPRTKPFGRDPRCRGRTPASIRRRTDTVFLSAPRQVKSIAVRAFFRRFQITGAGAHRKRPLVIILLRRRRFLRGRGCLNSIKTRFRVFRRTTIKRPTGNTGGTQKKNGTARERRLRAQSRLRPTENIPNILLLFSRADRKGGQTLSDPDFTTATNYLRKQDGKEPGRRKNDVRGCREGTAFSHLAERCPGKKGFRLLFALRP